MPGHRLPSTSGSEDQDMPSIKRRTVTFALDAIPPESEPVQSSPASISEDHASAAAVSARAQRSLRRQAKIEKNPKKKKSLLRHHSRSSSGRFSNSTASSKLCDGNLKRNLATASISNRGRSLTKCSSNTSSTKKGLSDKDEEVVKVKLNTGTLYLYKGVNRRAVFVRRL